MIITQILRLKDKYLPRILGLLLCCLSFCAFGQTYNPSVCCTVSNKSYGAAQSVSTDGRSWFYDATNFVMRDYNGTTEVFSYLNLPKYRSGHFPIFVHSGGILQGNGVWLGGSTLVYWFKDSTGNANLVRWYTDSTGVSGGPFYAVANNLSEGNAGLIKGNLTLDLVNNTSDAQKNAATVSLTNHTINGSLNTLTNIPNSALTNNSIGLSITSNAGSDISVTTTPAALGSSLVANIPSGGSSSRGAITSTDWNTFNGKQSPITLTVAGTSGPATFISNVLNIPQYSAGGGTPCLNCNADSLKHLPVDTSGDRNGYALTFDSLDHKWVLAPNGSGTGITALTGDGTASGSGTVALTLATVNSNVGTFGSASSVYQGTVNGKGLTTAATSVAIQIAESQVTNLTSDLAAKLSTTLPSADILVGNGSNVATAVAPSGDWTINNAGVNTLSNTAVTPGSYTATNLTVDSKGRITAAANGSSFLTSVPNYRYLGRAKLSGGSGLPDTLHYSTYNVLDFGIKDDSVTNNTTRMQQILDSVPAGSRFYFPGGGKGYRWDSILISKNTIFIGDGLAPFKIFTINLTPFNGATNLISTSPTKNFITIVPDPTTNQYPIVSFYDLSILNQSLTTPSSGAGLASLLTKQGYAQRVLIQGFYINCDIESNNFVFRDCFNVAPIKYGVLASSIANPDAGGTFFFGCAFISGFIDSLNSIGIYWRGGGLMYISDCNFNAQTFLSPTFSFKYPFYADFLDGSTSDLKILNPQIENFQTTAIKIDNRSGSRFSNIQIIGAQIAPFNNDTTTQGPGIEIDSCSEIVLSEIMGSNGSMINHPLVKLVKDTTGQIGLLLPYSRFASPGYAMADSLYSCIDIQRTIITSGIVGSNAGPNLLGIKEMGAADSAAVQIPMTQIWPAVASFNPVATFTDVLNITDGQNHITVGVADGTHSGVLNTLTQNIAGRKQFSVDGSFNGINIGTGYSTAGGPGITIGSSLNQTYTGTNNISVGAGNLTALTTGSSNVVIGNGIMFNNTTNNNNVGIGTSALNTTQSDNNTAIGDQAVVANNTGGLLTAIGSLSLNSNTSGARNTGVGASSLQSNTTASFNTCVGAGCLFSTVSGSNNTSLGYFSALTNSTHSGVIAIGYEAGYYEDADNILAIGNTQTDRFIAGNLSTNQACFNCNSTGTSPAVLTASAQLEVRGTTRASLLLTPMTTTQQNAISSPVSGDVIYNSDSAGLVDYNGSAWLKERTALIVAPLIKYQHTIFTPTTGGTVNLINGQYNIINPAGALLALTVNLPSSPANNDVVYIKFTQTISTVTYGNGTVVDGITAPTAGGVTILTYDSGTTSWY